VLLLVLCLGVLSPGCRSHRNAIWWADRYPKLIQTVERADNGSVVVSRQAGQGGRETVRYILTRMPDQGLVLEIVHPSQSFVKLGPILHQKEAVEVSPRIIIRDRDLDGSPDDSCMDFGALQNPDEKAFLPILKNDERNGFRSQWVDGIGFILNNVSGETESVNPAGKSIQSEN
jgi:hypothetical protein